MGSVTTAGDSGSRVVLQLGAVLALENIGDIGEELVDGNSKHAGNVDRYGNIVMRWCNG